MIKRKKGKGNKFARMNEEERARYMQHRVEFELEAKRRKQQLIAIFTKNKLKREGVFFKLNDAKINEKWRYILRQIKCTEFYEDIKHVSETFERALKIKNETISCLDKELKTADADHRKLQESHIMLINNIIGKYKEKLKILHDMYNLNNIECNNIIELNELKNYLKENCKEIYNIIQKKIISLNEKQSTKKIKNAVNILNIAYLNAIENLKSNIAITRMKRNSHIEILEAQATDINKKFKDIKQKIVIMQIIDSSKRKKLIITSNEILKYLQQIMEKSSMVLEMVKICSVLEPTSFNTKRYFTQDAIPTEFFDNNLPKSYYKINKFWEQYNYIKVDNILLKKKSNKLSAENEKLTHKLQGYITAVSNIPVLYPIVSPLI
ncbi:dynein regulatory complex subunit 2 isoform X2 [Osmia lignaria lignaria]|uniref:dynein regulatory complex subunit 2 isoform X2 n=1 Tax=Osmia lignaria lignaria TaxID=1437193 RepID=UPI00402B437C